MPGHEDDCDKVVYEGGMCTCGETWPGDSHPAGDASDGPTAAEEDYAGPALDW